MLEKCWATTPTRRRLHVRVRGKISAFGFQNVTLFVTGKHAGVQAQHISAAISAHSAIGNFIWRSKCEKIFNGTGQAWKPETFVLHVLVRTFPHFDFHIQLNVQISQQEMNFVCTLTFPSMKNMKFEWFPIIFMVTLYEKHKFEWFPIIFIEHQDELEIQNCAWKILKFQKFHAITSEMLEIIWNFQIFPSSYFTWKSWNFKICKWNVDIFFGIYTKKLGNSKNCMKNLGNFKMCMKFRFFQRLEIQIYMK